LSVIWQAAIMFFWVWLNGIGSAPVG
jgi:hypothetical protein